MKRFLNWFENHGSAMGTLSYILWGCVFAALPSLAFGLLAGIIMQDVGVGVVVYLCGFAFGLDVLFGKGAECRQYEK